MISQLLVLSVTILQVGAAAPSAKAKAAFDDAERALAAGQLQKAEAGYRKAVKASPDYPEALNGLGSALFKQGKRDDAIAHFKKAIEADPKFALAYFNLGYAARKTGDFATAAQAYQTYTEIKPEDPDGFYGLGESYKELGDLQRAIAAFEQYIAREKRPSEGKWVQRARQTVTDLKAKLAAAPPQPVQPAQPTQAAQPAQPSQPVQPSQQGAAAAPAPGRTVQPELARQRLAAGDGFMQAKQYREASFAYQDAVNADPNNVEALFKLGNCYAVLGYYTEAIDRWTRVAQLSPDANVRKSAEENIAKARQKMAQAGGAATPQAAGKPAGSGPVAPTTRSQARTAYEDGVKRIGARDYNGAVQSLTQAIQLEPALAVAYVARGSALIGLRRYAEAATDYQYANRLEPNLSSPLYGMAEAYRAQGRNADARQYYEAYAQSTAADARPELQEQARQKAAALR